MQSSYNWFFLTLIVVYKELGTKYQRNSKQANFVSTLMRRCVISQREWNEIILVGDQPGVVNRISDDTCGDFPSSAWALTVIVYVVS